MKSKNKIFTTTFTILLFIVIFIFCIILLFLLPLLKFRPWYRWWNTYDPDNKYNCFKISSLAYFESNTILYNISNLFIQPRQKFVYNWWVYYFILFNILWRSRICFLQRVSRRTPATYERV